MSHSVILLQIVMVSPKLKNLGPLCIQTVNLKTDSKTLYNSILKLIQSPSILKHNKGYTKHAQFNNSPNNCYRDHMNRIFCKNTSSDRSTNLCVLQDACHDLFCVFGDFYASRTQDTEVTKSLRIKLLLLSSPPLPEQQNLR